jgi:purine-binding chemotaxis protein CheW
MVPSEVAEDQKKVVIGQQGKRRIGIVVDGVSEILRVADEEIRPVAQLAFMESRAEANQVTGIAKIDGRLVVLLDLTRVLSERDQARVDAVSSA